MSISIKIKTLTGKNVLINIDPSCIIMDLMQKFYEIELLPIDQQRLIFSNKQMEHGRKISDYEIGENSIIYQCPIIRGGFIFASMDSLKKVKLHSSGSEHRTIR